MLTVARETSILFNDEYINHNDLIDNVQQRLQKDIQLLELNAADLKDAMDYSKDRGKRVIRKI
jgi:hypothetical protein